MRKKIVLISIVCIIFASIYFLLFSKPLSKEIAISPKQSKSIDTIQNALSIETMRQKQYPGSAITIEKTFPDGTNFHQYLTSYLSDNLKIYALLTVPIGLKPANGWPVIIFNHGYISPKQYQTFPSVGQYVSYYPPFSSNGYIVFKPDYRGNGNSQGYPEGTYYSPAYTTDDLNALSSIKKYSDANPQKIGIWGHSMGGNITLKDLVIDPKDIKAAVIWGGVIGSYSQILNWHDPLYKPPSAELALRNLHRADLVAKYGTPDSNKTFWDSIDPLSFVSDITTPVQIHAGSADEEVPPIFSQTLYDRLLAAHKTVELFMYSGANHNISEPSFSLAMERSLAFFNTYLK